jgi:hypothetical protein
MYAFVLVFHLERIETAASYGRSIETVFAVTPMGV